MKNMVTLGLPSYGAIRISSVYFKKFPLSKFGEYAEKNISAKESLVSRILPSHLKRIYMIWKYFEKKLKLSKLRGKSITFLYKYFKSIGLCARKDETLVGYMDRIKWLPLAFRQRFWMQLKAWWLKVWVHPSRIFGRLPDGVAHVCRDGRIVWLKPKKRIVVKNK